MKKRLSTTCKGAVLSIIITALLSLLLTALVFCGDIPDKAITALVFFIASLSCITGAYSSGKVLSSKGLVTGGMLGIIYYIILLAVCSVITKNFAITSNMMIMLVSVMMSGMLGGVLGMPR